MPVLDRVASLIDKSLLHQIEQEGEEPRYMILETIRKFGLEMLAASEELETTQQAHAEYYLRLAEKSEQRHREPRQVVRLERLQREHDNLRAAIQWSIERGEAGHNLEIALRLAAVTMSTPTSDEPSAPPAKSAISYPAGLSAREVEILRLVAQGLTDAQVADQLVLSRYTVSTHLHSIYSKLGVTSRTAATRFAVEQRLV